MPTLWDRHELVWAVFGWLQNILSVLCLILWYISQILPNADRLFSPPINLHWPFDWLTNRRQQKWVWDTFKPRTQQALQALFSLGLLPLSLAQAWASPLQDDKVHGVEISYPGGNDPKPTPHWWLTRISNQAQQRLIGLRL